MTPVDGSILRPMSGRSDQVSEEPPIASTRVDGYAWPTIPSGSDAVVIERGLPTFTVRISDATPPGFTTRTWCVPTVTSADGMDAESCESETADAITVEPSQVT